MRDEIKQLCRDLARVFLYLFALIGVVATVYGSYGYWHRPATFAAPNSFLILDIYKTTNREGPRTRIYLDSVSSPSALRFEGPELSHELAGALHSDSTVPLAGILVGKVVFGQSVIGVNDGSIDINGDRVCSPEITLTRYGTIRNGPIRIAR